MLSDTNSANILNQELGNVHINENVLKTIAAFAVGQINDISDMKGRLSEDFSEALGIRGTKGITVYSKDKELAIDLSVIIKYAQNVYFPDIASQLQKKVKSEIESITGLTVANVNINIQDLNVITDEVDEK